MIRGMTQVVLVYAALIRSGSISQQ